MFTDKIELKDFDKMGHGVQGSSGASANHPVRLRNRRSPSLR